MLSRVLDPRQAVQALQHRPFRWWLVERSVGSITWAMRGVARGWLVYSLTGSVLALAWVEAARAIMGVVVSPIAGVVCDRIEKRLVMLGARVLLIFTNLSLATLIFLGRLELWHIIAVTLVEATVYAVMEPALQSILPEIVGREALLGATSIMFVVEWVLQVASAGAAGVVIAGVGAGWVFLMNAPLFALASYALSRIPRGLAAGSGGSLRGDLAAALRYLAASPVLIILVALSFVRLLFTQPLTSFLAAFSQGLGFDAAGLGMLASASGVGALASSVVIVGMGNPTNKGKLLLGSGVASAVSVIALMAAGTQVSPFMLIMLVGAFSNAATVFTRTLMLLACEPVYRGRVAGVAMVFSDLVILSIVPAGALADVYGVPIVVGVLAVLALVVHIGAAVFLPSIRKLS